MAKHRIYAACCWRNEFYPEVVEALRAAGHDVYDFRKLFDGIACSLDEPIKCYNSI